MSKKINLSMSLKDAALLLNVLCDVAKDDLVKNHVEWETIGFVGAKDYFAYDFDKAMDVVDKTRVRLCHKFDNIDVLPWDLDSIKPEPGPTAVEEDEVDITPLVEASKHTRKYHILVKKIAGNAGYQRLLTEYHSLSCAVEEAIEYAADDKFGCYLVTDSKTGEILFDTHED